MPLLVAPDETKKVHLQTKEQEVKNGESKRKKGGGWFADPAT